MLLLTALLSPAHGADVVALTAGTAHACVLREDGAVACWGDNRHGQLGAGDFRPHVGAVEVDLPTPAVDLRAHGSTTCMVDAMHRTFCWGKDALVPVSRRGDLHRDTPTPAPQRWFGPAERLAQAGCVDLVGGDHHCSNVNLPAGRRSKGPAKDSSVVCEPTDQGFACTYGTLAVDLPFEPIVLDANAQGGCAAHAEETRCFDRDGVFTHALPGTSLLAMGADFVCIADGPEIHCSGGNQRGQLGVAAPTRDVLEAVEVPVHADELAVVDTTTCVRDGDDVLCWGPGTAPERLDLPPVDRLTSNADRFCARGDQVHCWAPGATPSVWDVDASVDLTGSCAVGANDLVSCVDKEPLTLPGALSADAARYGICIVTTEGAACTSTRQNIGRLTPIRRSEGARFHGGKLITMAYGRPSIQTFSQGPVHAAKGLPDDLDRAWAGPSSWYGTPDGAIWSNAFGHATIAEPWPSFEGALTLEPGTRHVCAILPDRQVRCAGRADLLGVPMSVPTGTLRTAPDALISVQGL